MAAREDLERETTGERGENGAHLGEHEGILLHVRVTHALGQAGAGGLGAHELAGSLGAVPHRQRSGHVLLASDGDARNQIVDRHLAQRVAGALGLAKIAVDQAPVGAAEARDRLTGREMHDRIDVDARVRLPPAEHGKMKHDVRC